MSLKKKINLVVFLTLLAVLGGAFILISYLEKGKLIDQARESAEYLSEAVQANAEQILDQIQVRKQSVQVVVQEEAKNAAIEEITVFNESFKVTASSNPDIIGKKASAEDIAFLSRMSSENPLFFDKRESEENYIYRRFFAIFSAPPRITEESVSYLSLKASFKKGSAAEVKANEAVLEATEELLTRSVKSTDISVQNGMEYLRTLSNKMARLDAVSGVFIFDDNLNALAESDALSLNADNPAYAKRRKSVLGRKEVEAIYSVKSEDGGEIMVRVTPILTSRISSDTGAVEGKKVGGLIEIRMSMSALNAKITALTKELVNAAVISIILLFVILFYFLNKEIVVPIASLSEVAEKVSKGDFNQEAAVTARNEIGGFASTFNKMIKNIRELDKVKSEFVSIASHQLRTPLSAIKWSLKMLSNGDFGSLTEEQKEVVENSYQSNEKLISLVHDLLDVSRIEEKRLKYEFAEGNLVEVAMDVFKGFVQLAKAKGIEFVFSASDNIPLMKFDESKIRMVFQNLIDNAVKYTPEKGTIKVVFESTPETIRFYVRDTGMGIPRNQMDRLFKKFFRARNVIASTEGTGLGLFIVKNIIEAHNGKIWAESEEGKGTVFYVEFPISK